MSQIVYHHPGAGTETPKVTRALGGAFGIGVAQDIAESYRFICNNYNTGDEIVTIGFSRGAFTARSVAAMRGRGNAQPAHWRRNTHAARPRQRGRGTGKGGR